MDWFVYDKDLRHERVKCRVYQLYTWNVSDADPNLLAQGNVNVVLEKNKKAFMIYFFWMLYLFIDLTFFVISYYESPIITIKWVDLFFKTWT